MSRCFRSLPLLQSVVAIALFVTGGCGHSAPDQRLHVLEEEVAKFVVPEAEQAFEQVYHARFDATVTRMLIGEDLKRWSSEHPISVRNLPAELKTSIARNEGVALLIRGGLPDKGGRTQDVVYLRSSPLRPRRFFLVAQPDPCGDANPAMCERCTGCSGETSPGSTIKTCVCTYSCDDCRPCPTC